MADKQDQYLKELNVFCWENGFNPEPTRTERLAYFAQLVIEKNKKLNLISKRDIDSIIEKEYIVKIDRLIDDNNLKLLNFGLKLDNKNLKPIIILLLILN